MNRMVSKQQHPSLDTLKSQLADQIATAIKLGTQHHKISVLHVRHRKGDKAIEIGWGIEGMDCTSWKIKLEPL